MSIKKKYEEYKSIILYLFFGICTTVTNVTVYWIVAHLLQFRIMSSTIIAWIAAVLFAYITNRKWVFRSNATNINDILKEMISFFMCRLATGGVDWVCMFIFVSILGINDVIIKFASNIVVIVLNFIASKLVIFKDKEKLSND